MECDDFTKDEKEKAMTPSPSKKKRKRVFRQDDEPSSDEEGLAPTSSSPGPKTPAGGPHFPKTPATPPHLPMTPGFTGPGTPVFPKSPGTPAFAPKTPAYNVAPGTPGAPAGETAAQRIARKAA